MLNGLDLFSGIGGLTEALAPWVHTVGYCENDQYAQSVLLSRMGNGDLPSAAIWDDVQTLSSETIGAPIDIVFGGFPCQDISCAGHGIGLEGKRSGLFFEIIRLVRELRPRFVFLENVPAITLRGLDRILLEITALGYDSRWTIVSAAEVGACHLRERWFLLAHSNSNRGRLQSVSRSECGNTLFASSYGETQYVGNSPFSGRERANGENGIATQKLAQPARFNGWKSEPTVRGRAHGIQHRRDRLRVLGNAVVPMQARKAFMILMGIKPDFL